MSNPVAIDSQSAIASLIYEARIAAYEALDRLESRQSHDAEVRLANAICRLNSAIHILEKCGRAA